MKAVCCTPVPGLMRLFVGCRFDAATRDALAAMKSPCPGMRWVAPDTYHITLQFLGAMEPAVVPQLIQALEQVKGGRFTLKSGAPGYFAHGERRVLYSSVVGTEALRVLRAEVQKALGTVLEVDAAKNWQPHVTLGRSNRGAEPSQAELDSCVAAMGEKPGPDLPVDSFALVHSVFTPDGVRHTELKRFPLD